MVEEQKVIVDSVSVGRLKAESICDVSLMTFHRTGRTGTKPSVYLDDVELFYAGKAKQIRREHAAAQPRSQIVTLRLTTILNRSPSGPDRLRPSPPP